MAPIQINEKLILRLLRIFILSFSAIGLYLSTKNLYLKWKSDPDITTTESFISSTEIPMPAITICSPLIAPKDSMDFKAMREDYKANKNNFSLDKYKDMGGDDCFGPVLKACAQDRILDFFKKMNIKRNFHDEFIKCHGKFPKKEAKFNCYIGHPGRLVEIDSIYTQHGQCISVNMLDGSEIFSKDVMTYDINPFRKNYSQIPRRGWTLEGGYKNDEITYPTRAEESIVYYKMNQCCELSISDDERKNLCPWHSYNFDIIFHLPNEMPTTFHMKNFIEFDTEKIVEITAKLYTTDDDLRKYSPIKRGCNFEGDRKLKYFASYTKTLCEFECLVNFTYNKCGCVAFSMPRTFDMRYCGYDELDCEQDAYIHLNVTKCDCLPACTDIKYSISFERTVKHSTWFCPRFGLRQVPKEERFAAYRIDNLISDCLGQSGFFLGFSVLTIIELIERLLKYFRKKENDIDDEKSQNVDKKIPHKSHFVINDALVEIQADLNKDEKHIRVY